MGGTQDNCGSGIFAHVQVHSRDVFNHSASATLTGLQIEATCIGALVDCECLSIADEQTIGCKNFMS